MTTRAMMHLVCSANDENDCSSSSEDKEVRGCNDLDQPAGGGGQPSAVEGVKGVKEPARFGESHLLFSFLRRFFHDSG